MMLIETVKFRDDWQNMEMTDKTGVPRPQNQPITANRGSYYSHDVDYETEASIKLNGDMSSWKSDYWMNLKRKKTLLSLCFEGIEWNLAGFDYNSDTPTSKLSDQ